MRILNFGSLNIDYVYSVPHIVRPGETVSSGGRAVYFGGKGLNQSIAAARAGADVSHAGQVGPDGEGLLRECERYGVGTGFIRRGDIETGHTFIQVDEDGQNSIVLFGGSNRAIGREHVDQFLGNFGAGDILILQNEINGIGYIIEQAAARGMQIVLNPSPCDQAVMDCGLRLVSWLILNEVEGGQITGSAAPEDMLRELSRRFPDTGIVLTLGADGAYCCQGEDTIFQPSFPVKPVDTTAAGDTFLGFFVAGLAEGLDLPAIMERAAAAAAIAITRQGAAPSIPDRAQVEEYLSQRAAEGSR